MATLAYPPFHDDNFSRSISRSRSRRGSMVGYQAAPKIAYPYGDNRSSMYNDAPLSAGLHGENYSQPSYQIYAQPERSRRSQVFDDIANRDSYNRDSYYRDDRQASPTSSRSSTSQHNAIPLRQRRHSTSVAFDMRAAPMDTYRRMSSTVIKLKRKGAYRSGLTIGDAQNNVKLSGADAYSFRDFNCDLRGRIAMKIRWAGYPSLTYDIPLDGYNDRVNLQTLARRTARAVVHFLQANVIPIPWDCVEMLRLEEVAPGTWQPVLAVR